MSFAIPTWNRSDRLKICVELIAAQIATLAEHVEIVISDNGSEDDTSEVVAALVTRFHFVRGFRNLANIGSDMNVASVLGLAQGEYVWLFSDDDFLAQDALREVVRIIKTYRPSEISTNYYACGDDGKFLDRQDDLPYLPKSDIANVGLDELFAHQGMRLSFMSRVIYQRSLLDIANYKKEAHRVTPWMPLYVTAHVASQDSRCYISSFFAVGWRLGHSRDHPSAFLKKMPEMLDSTLRRFGASEETREKSIDGIREYFINWRSYIKFRNAGLVMSPLIVPASYRFIPPLPSFLVRFALRLKARIHP